MVSPFRTSSFTRRICLFQKRVSYFGLTMLSQRLVRFSQDDHIAMANNGCMKSLLGRNWSWMCVAARFIALCAPVERDESRSYAFVLSLTYKYFIHPI